MKNEIERKFFVKKLPDLTKIIPISYERYFLKNEDGVEELVSKINSKYFYYRKVEISNLERSREKKEITEHEFKNLKKNASEVIIRDGYNISNNPAISLKVYHGRFEGLMRAEVEFSSLEEASSFKPLYWMGQEMTGLSIARDSKLINLSREDLAVFLHKPN